MGFEGFGIEDAKVRENRGEWLGAGNHQLELMNFKQYKGDTFAEFKVLSSRDRGVIKTEHVPGDVVSIKWNTAGTGRGPAMAVSDVKTFLFALIKSCGRDPSSIAGAQWVTVADNAAAGKAIGAHVQCGAWHPVNQDTGEVSKFIRATWNADDASPKRPELFTGYGFESGGAAPKPNGAPASRPGAKPGAKPPAVDEKKRAEVLDALNEWKNEGRMTRDAVLAPASDYYTWGVSVVGASVYAELVAQVFDLPAGM